MLLISALIYDLDVLRGASDFLYNYMGWCSHRCLILTSRVLTRTPAHIWGRLYLPLFLFRVGLLILLYMDALFVVVKPCPSLPSMLRLSVVVRWPVVVWWLYMDEGTLKLSLHLFPNVLADSPIYFSLQLTLFHLYQYNIPLLHCIGSISFVDTSIFLIVLLLPEVCVDAILNTYAFNAVA